MSNFITVKFNVSKSLPLNMAEFFHLDAEIFHKDVESFQILTFNKIDYSCVVEIFSELSKEELKKEIQRKQFVLSIDNYNLDFEIIEIYWNEKL